MGRDRLRGSFQGGFRGFRVLGIPLGLIQCGNRTPKTEKKVPGGVQLKLSQTRGIKKRGGLDWPGSFRD